MCATRRQTTCSCETEIAMKIALVAGLSLGMLVPGPCRAEDSVPEHIQNLQGCFRVSYRFVEDGKHDYEVKDVLEWITLQRQSGAYLIQHYGLIGGKVMEHFNETWSALRDGRWAPYVALYLHLTGPDGPVELLVTRRPQTHSRPSAGRLRSAQPWLNHSDHAKGLGPDRDERQGHESG